MPQWLENIQLKQMSMIQRNSVSTRLLWCTFHNTVHASTAAGLTATLLGRKNWPPSCRELLPLSQVKGWRTQKQNQTRCLILQDHLKHYTLHVAFCSHGCLYTSSVWRCCHYCMPTRSQGAFGSTVAGCPCSGWLWSLHFGVIDAAIHETNSFDSASRPWL